jgi:hypothetical protein
VKPGAQSSSPTRCAAPAWPPSIFWAGTYYGMSADYDVDVDEATGRTDGYVRIRLDQTAQDHMSGSNRPEHLRAFPEHDPVFAAIQRPLRSSA